PRRRRAPAASCSPAAPPERAQAALSAGQLSASLRSSIGSVSTLTSPRVAIVSRFDDSTGDGASGQGVSTTGSTSRPAPRAAPGAGGRGGRGGGGGVVARPGPRRARAAQRRAEVEREMADGVAGGERDHQSAAPRADEPIGARGRSRRARPQPLGVDLLARQ